jgi:hypothetical protein
MLESKIRQARIKNQQRLAEMTPAQRDAINAVMNKSAYDKFVESEAMLATEASAFAALITFDRLKKNGGAK